MSKGTPIGVGIVGTVALAVMASQILSSTMSQMLPRVVVSPFASSSAGGAGRWSRFIQSSSAFVPQTLLRPAALSLTIPGLIADIWDSVLRAVPKKKVSHMKRRHRQMAGKGLKDVKSLNTCPGCGNIKRAHVLCSHCVSGVYPLSFEDI